MVDGRQLVRLVPPRMRAPLARAHRPLARRAAARFYVRKYGAPFFAKVDDDDDLLQYSLDVAATHPAFRYHEGVRMYFQGGEWNAAEMEKVFRDVGVTLRDARVVLEFAAGWGRVTRHLVHLVDPARITVSDIDHRAVDFVTRELGVRGFYSTATPDALTCDERFDLILVVSLFSHLPDSDWSAWLSRLIGLLEPGGTLAVSTLGMHAFEVNVADPGAFEPVTEGFWYRGENETRGRLPGEQYGVAYVDEAYVRRVVAADDAAELLAFVPRALNGFQDVYVIRRR